ncbi:AraC family transcriptional regulator [Promicromonospora sukumoe]|uniref:AraC family transcriptional regulator n=1 Tax=Promicromonospora sukumoe TaxID=88382 RepID=UPI0037C599F8
MDVLSSVISSVRVGRAESCSVKGSGAWGWRYPQLEGSGFHVVLHGGAWLITSEDPPRELKPGDVVLIPSGATHGLSHAPATLDALQPAVMTEDPGPGSFDTELLCGAYWLEHGPVHPYLRSLPEVLTVSPDYDRDPRLSVLADLLRADVADAGPGTRATRPALLDVMLTHILRQWLDVNQPAWWPQVTDPGIDAALRAIHTDPHLPWTVDSLSQAAGMSRTTFINRFKALLDQPPMAYLTDWRLTRGAQLLRETDAPLAAVARRVGYSTEFAFSASFRRRYSVSPGRFRLAHDLATQDA